MARQRTNKTASKRIRVTNPKGNRKPKILYSKTAKHHLKTKRSSRSKRRKANIGVASATNAKKIVRAVKNLV
jgi:ribosomal protein L35